MAKRPPPPQRRLANLDPDVIPAAIRKLERRIADLKAATPANKEDLSSTIESLCTKVNNTLAEVFGLDTVEYDRADVSQSRFYVPRVVAWGGEIPWAERMEEFESGRVRTISALQSEIDLLNERMEDEDDKTHSSFAKSDRFEEAFEGLAVDTSSTNEVFVVHGQDNAAREEVARFLEKAGLIPVVLHEQANEGKTVIEKFERHAARIGFAVILLTPDDVGGPNGGAMQPRARQNVIAELFYFMGKLGRSRICALRKGDVEIPSDIAGLVYTPLDSNGGWKVALLRELASAGYPVKWEALR